ncbi:MAG: 3-methyl-2-oxobutanoate hydroxymethyltransferase [Myxococcota bacterium]
MYGTPSAGGGDDARRPRKKVTAPAICARKGQTPIAMVTAYDFTIARLLDAAGVDVLLVGDSLGMVVQGQSTTLPVTLDEVAYHTRAVVRGAERALVVADMPFMSFQVSPAQALENAGTLVKTGGAEAVKLEGGRDVAEHVRRITRAGIPVVGHVGLTPQSVHALGGFKVQGKADAAAAALLEDAQALADAGAFAIVLEAIPPDLAAAVTDSIAVPTIGIGAGPDCDGQVLVCYDMLGMTGGRVPKFTKQFAAVGDAIETATRAFVDEVQTRVFPAPAHTYRPRIKKLDDAAQ